MRMSGVFRSYVQTCQGSPEAALANLRLLWLGGEIRDMLRWMCEWNQAHPHPGGHPPFLEPGRVYELSDFAMVPRRQFDALIYQETSRKMTAIFWESPCP